MDVGSRSLTKRCRVNTLRGKESMLMGPSTVSYRSLTAGKLLFVFILLSVLIEDYKFLLVVQERLRLW